MPVISDIINQYIIYPEYYYKSYKIVETIRKKFIHLVLIVLRRTSWERHKSEPRLKIKNSTKTSKRQVFFSIVPEKPKGEPHWRAKTGTLWDFLTSNFSKYQNIEGEPLVTLKKLSKKFSQCRNKNGKGTL